MVFVAGQIGWDETHLIRTDSMAGQVEQTLKNTLAVLAEADAEARHIVRMTWYITSRADYLAEIKNIGRVWRNVMGQHYPVMAVVELSQMMSVARLFL